VFHSRHESLDPNRPTLHDTHKKLQKAFNQDDTVSKLENLLHYGSAHKKSCQSSSPTRRNQDYSDKMKKDEFLRSSAPVQAWKEDSVPIAKYLRDNKLEENEKDDLRNQINELKQEAEKREKAMNTRLHALEVEN